MKRSKTETILNIVTAISLVMFLWLFVSYIDIVSHNLTTQEYMRFNFFEMVLEHLY